MKYWELVILTVDGDPIYHEDCATHRYALERFNYRKDRLFTHYKALREVRPNYVYPITLQLREYMPASRAYKIIESESFTFTNFTWRLPL